MFQMKLKSGKECMITPLWGLEKIKYYSHSLVLRGKEEGLMESRWSRVGYGEQERGEVRVKEGL